MIRRTIIRTIEVPAEKRCLHCREVKPLEEFWRDSGRADGHTTRCLHCERARKKKQRSTPEARAKVSAYNRDYYRRRQLESFGTGQAKRKHGSRNCARRQREHTRGAPLPSPRQRQQISSASDVRALSLRARLLAKLPRPLPESPKPSR